MKKEFTPGETSDSKEKSLYTNMIEIHRRATAGEGFVAYHGGLEDNLTLDKIDLDKEGLQQNKPGRTYGGFYLTDETSREWTNQYARQRNGNVHAFLISCDARILTVDDKDIDRLSQSQRVELSKKYDIVKGHDLLGRTQYVLLSKEVITGVASENIQTM